MGLHRAWPSAEIIGVDNKPQPRYPFDFVQADGMEYPLHGFDFIWASPPCQGYSRLRHLPWLKGKTWPLLIEPIRERLKKTRASWCIENVMDAPLIGFFLCGQNFGLQLYRHRRFETNFLVLTPPHLAHLEVIGRGRMVNDRRKGSLNAGSSKGAWGTPQGVITVAGGQFKKAEGEKAMGIDWMRKDELCEAIPPVYSEYIARQIPL